MMKMKTPLINNVNINSPEEGVRCSETPSRDHFGGGCNNINHDENLNVASCQRYFTIKRYRLQRLNSAGTQPGLETSEDTADPEDGVSYASISYTKKTSRRSQVRNDDEGDSVTYSSVKVSSSADPSDLYATVDKAHK
ncbi:hypothetical protein FQN60_015444 [Etheostoma spectabile]|uniref:Uncharacterized protein n=1 Tax=Etheostoma spectabile TaxID=54343 RepID=A0A5J5CLQ0_9PERO|nr:hypothetical protein FQN60_015444 [Etheostoma spectabile]